MRAAMSESHAQLDDGLPLGFGTRLQSCPDFAAGNARWLPAAFRRVATVSPESSRRGARQARWSKLPSPEIVARRVLLRGGARAADGALSTLRSRPAAGHSGKLVCRCDCCAERFEGPPDARRG